MQRNTCGRDRVARLIGGTALLALAARAARRSGDRVGLGTQLLAYTGGEVLATGLTGYCPLNSLLGRDTCASDDDGGGDRPSGPGSGGDRRVAPRLS